MIMVMALRLILERLRLGGGEHDATNRSIKDSRSQPAKIPITWVRFSEALDGKEWPKSIDDAFIAVRREHHRHEHRETYGQKRFPHGAALFALLGGRKRGSKQSFHGAGGCPTRFDQRAASKIPLHTSIGGKGENQRTFSDFTF
jgi:hypothetical protein